MRGHAELFTWQPLMSNTDNWYPHSSLHNRTAHTTRRRWALLRFSVDVIDPQFSLILGNILTQLIKSFMRDISTLSPMLADFLFMNFSWMPFWNLWLPTPCCAGWYPRKQTTRVLLLRKFYKKSSWYQDHSESDPTSVKSPLPCGFIPGILPCLNGGDHFGGNFIMLSILLLLV